MVGLLVVAACTSDKSASRHAQEESVLRQQLAVARESARVETERQAVLVDSISKLQLRIEQTEASLARASAPPPSVAGTWTDGRHTLRMSENGTYSLMDPSGAFEGYWQLDRGSRRLVLSPPLGSRISGQVAEDWRSVAVDFEIVGDKAYHWVLNRQE